MRLVGAIWRLYESEQKANKLYPPMEETRKRVLGIIAGILIARHLKTPEDSSDTRPSPRTENLLHLLFSGPNGSCERWIARLAASKPSAGLANIRIRVLGPIPCGLNLPELAGLPQRFAVNDAFRHGTPRPVFHFRTRQLRRRRLLLG